MCVHERCLGGRDKKHKDIQCNYKVQGISIGCTDSMQFYWYSMYSIYFGGEGSI